MQKLRLALHCSVPIISLSFSCTWKSLGSSCLGGTKDWTMLDARVLLRDAQQLLPWQRSRATAQTLPDSPRRGCLALASATLAARMSAAGKQGGGRRHAAVAQTGPARSAVTLDEITSNVTCPSGVHLSPVTRET